ncbi:pickpocket protein 28 [Anoplophora glabripennis]|uniref:pickpocket protein 28 n=1 Tax=Anoplophora glabripennis TaxID=217634 RepID=UPI000C786B4C|nr:pickpocket protein 28 [Anoplophora glabripennis]
MQKFNSHIPVIKIRENDFPLSQSSGNNRGNDRKRNKYRKRNRTKEMLHQLEIYCDKSTLHGLRYIGDTSLTFAERIFWLISFSVAIGFAAYYISNIYEKWQSSPVIISFSPFDADLSTIPFPAITICNMNQAKKTEAERILKEGSLEELKLLNDVCNGNQTSSYSEVYNWTTLRNFLIKVGASCSDVLRVCEWTNDKVDCDELFNNDLTDEGLCCSFNRLPPKKIFRNENDISILNQTYPSNVYDWNPEKGFTEEETGDENTVPKRPLGAGSHLGLSLILDAQVDNYYCSSTSSIGFKIILSNPIETPKMADFGSLLSPGMEVRFSITPSVREAADNLRSIPIKKRQCYFSNERRLSYYRSYTQRNCNLECQSNYTYEKCYCIPYYLPRNKFIKVCGKSDQECVATAKEDMEITYGNGSSCNCLPGCFEMNFSDSKSYSVLSDKIVNLHHIGNISTDYFIKNMAVVHFFFPSSKFSKQVKSQLYGFTEILSNVGGLLGLFMGFSFLSFVELVYFVTLRFLCNYLKTKHKIEGNKNKTPWISNYSVYPFIK